MQFYILLCLTYLVSTLCTSNSILGKEQLHALQNSLDCSATSIIASDSVHMVLIEGSKFYLGSDYFEDAKPKHEVEVSSFYMDEHEVTNAQFAVFVAETNYITVAERPLDPKDFPGVDPNILVPGSAVFVGDVDVNNLENPTAWWSYINGACWKHPEGPQSNINGRENHPVVHIAYEDAHAYATWVGKRLPTEAEWELAAKGGTHINEEFYWGNELKKNGEWMANTFQGSFPKMNAQLDGFKGTAPVKSFPPNAIGLYDMVGNVWEWCSDYYRSGYDSNASKINPKGPIDSHDPLEPNLVKKVQRGGSFLCVDNYCQRYKAGGRGKGEINSPTNNVGFRCVKDI